MTDEKRTGSQKRVTPTACQVVDCQIEVDTERDSTKIVQVNVEDHVAIRHGQIVFPAMVSKLYFYFSSYESETTEAFSSSTATYNPASTTEITTGTRELPPYLRLELSFTPRILAHPTKEAVKDEISSVNLELRKQALSKLSGMPAKHISEEAKELDSKMQELDEEQSARNFLRLSMS
ncbi:Hypothetical predicted protein [Mytilus galloprovincialis]|uniref:Uncharacterized protein n=1 Tax=Mytilus galloprovincialis TaxID=29158 RepID=A0A8B6FCP4_MYTGA|nr:Hypothetical predicted protein [Mytilus galloprovincialis]